MRVGEDEVVMVAEDAEGVDADAEAAGGEGEEVEEGLVDELPRAEEELPLGASARDKVGGSGEDLARGGHGRRHGRRRGAGAGDPSRRARPLVASCSNFGRPFPLSRHRAS